MNQPLWQERPANNRAKNRHRKMLLAIQACNQLLAHRARPCPRVSLNVLLLLAVPAPNRNYNVAWFVHVISFWTYNFIFRHVPVTQPAGAFVELLT
jgi:hypothetical protein